MTTMNAFDLYEQSGGKLGYWYSALLKNSVVDLVKYMPVVVGQQLADGDLIFDHKGLRHLHSYWTCGTVQDQTCLVLRKRVL